MGIVDFRFRPHTRETMESIAQSPIFRKGLTEAGLDFEEFLASAKPMDEIAQELRENGIEKAVIVGRDAETTYNFKPNHEEILPFIQTYPDLFKGFAGVDPHKGMEAVYRLRDLVEKEGFCGAAIDPIYAQIPANDARYYPIYAKCCELGVPVVITSGLSPKSPRVTIDSSNPIYIDMVARDFPELKIVVSHGGYPWVNEIIGVAFRNSNVYLDLSEVETHPMGEAYIQAANTILKDKVLFASAHPFVHYLDAVRLYERLPFTEEARAMVMAENGRRVLGE